MAEQKTAAKRTAKRTSGEASGTFTDEEKAAAKERVKEMRRSPRASKADGERDVLEKISEMDDTDRVMAGRIHAIVTASAPDLAPRTWYGMPAYAMWPVAYALTKLTKADEARIAALVKKAAS
jgi:hypothetical protein